MKILINLLLLLIAWFLLRIVLIVSFVWTVVKLSLKLRFKDLSDYFYQSALTLDMSGNVIGQHFFNDLLIRPNGYRFGEHGVTISKTLAINKKKGTWYPLAKLLGNLLDWIDKNHLEKSKV